MADLDDLPTLKAYRISGPALFSATPVVWVYVQFTRDNVETLQREFHDFLSREKLWTRVRAGHSGGGSFGGAFTPEAAEKLKAWLVEHGCAEEELPW